MRKENEIIEITEEVKIGNGIILEKGDKIEIIKESMGRFSKVRHGRERDAFEDLKAFFKSDKQLLYAFVDELSFDDLGKVVLGICNEYDIILDYLE